MAADANAPWLADLAIPDDDNWIWDWYRHYGNYDNRPQWAQIHVPVLILFGGKDALVPVQESISDVVRTLKAHGNSHVAIRVFQDADHTLHVPPASRGEWPHLPKGFPDVLRDFIVRPSYFTPSSGQKP